MHDGQERQQTRGLGPNEQSQPDRRASYFVPPPPAPASRPKRNRAWPVTLTLLGLVLVVATIASGLIVELWLGNRVVPGVYVWDINLGGLRSEQARERLAARFEYPADRELTLRYEGQVWPVRPSDLGAQLDVAATGEAAMAIGHTGGLPTRLREQAEVMLHSRLVMPVLGFDSGQGAMFLSRIALAINRPLRNAKLTVASDLSVGVIPGQAGREMNQAATLQLLEQRIEEMGGGEVPVLYWESEPLLANLSIVQAQVQSYLSGPIVLSAPGVDAWTVEPETLAEWLTLEPATGTDGKATLVADLNTAELRRLAQEIARQVSYQPASAQFRFDDAAGSLEVVVESALGRTLDVTTTMALVEQAAGQPATADNNHRSVELPLVAVRPALASEDAARLGIVELIGEGTTSFAGSSAERAQNIVVGAAQFDGLLISPGETFSFNRYLGEVTAEKGYEESIIIWGNTTRADVGGGLCQVSSTAFRAAFWAGLPIVERWAHAFRVSYYEPPVGMDATIYSPQVDLRWENDTGHYILIQTYVDRAKNTLTFRYYGTNPGRTVKMDGPYESNPVTHGPAVYREDPTLPKGQTKQIEWAKDGLDVTVYRTVTGNGETRRDTFFSRYRPWQAVYLVGTREEP